MSSAINMSDITTTIKRAQLKDGTKILYREAGSKCKPNFLLLHGFPTSSYMFRNLIPLLAPHFHVIAPDMPGFGFTESPSDYKYTFANLSKSIEEFVEIIKFNKFAVYIFDYGAPVAYRLALNNPKKITAIVSQNGNAYEEGIDERFWAPISKWWETGNPKDPESVETLTKVLQNPGESIESQYKLGVKDPDSIDPAPAALDEFLTSKPGQLEIQLGLFYDYGTNLKLYPQFQKFLRDSKIPVLLTWGQNDLIFNVDGAEGYKKDVKDLRIKYFNTGHFALETHLVPISKEIVDFLKEKL